MLKKLSNFLNPTNRAFPAYNFDRTDLRHNTVLLTGVIGSGKSSFMVQYTKTLIDVLAKEEDEEKIFKNAFVNINKFEIEKFNEMAKEKGLELEFYWLDMNHFKEFAYESERLYLDAQTHGETDVTGYIYKHLSKTNLKYIDSFIVCDEAHKYFSKKDNDLAAFMRFKRNHRIEFWYLTQKFQNLHEDFYNSGSINTLYRIRNPEFNVGNTKILQLWSDTNTAKKDNCEIQYSYTIEPVVYKLYRPGASLAQGVNTLAKLKKYSLYMVLAAVFCASVFYFIFSEKISSNESSSQAPATVAKVTKEFLPQKKQINLDNMLIVKCFTVRNSSNCYFQGQITSVKNDYIKSIVKNENTNVEVYHSHKKLTFLAMDLNSISLLFEDLNLKEDR